jgi:hypothetical protein
MKIFYKPFGIIAGIIGAKLSRRVFDGIWGAIDTQPPPSPGNESANLPKVVGAAVVQAATFAAVRAAVDRAALRWFQFTTGIWAGEKDQPPQLEE